jgi:hypothetical protein
MAITSQKYSVVGKNPQHALVIDVTSLHSPGSRGSKKNGLARMSKAVANWKAMVGREGRD